MNTKDKLTYLLMHYQQTRGAGHTKALYDGLKPAIRLENNPPSPAVVMGATKEIADRLFPFLRPNQRTGWSLFDEKEAYRLRTRQHPLVLDNSAIVDILQDALKCIEDMELEIWRIRHEPTNEQPTN